LAASFGITTIAWIKVVAYVDGTKKLLFGCVTAFYSSVYMLTQELSKISSQIDSALFRSNNDCDNYRSPP
jgi:hypothetical protein